MGGLTDAAVALRALYAGSERQGKSYRTKQDSKAEPEASVRPSVARNNGGTDSEQKPDY